MPVNPRESRAGDATGDPFARPRWRALTRP